MATNFNTLVFLRNNLLQNGVYLFVCFNLLFTSLTVIVIFSPRFCYPWGYNKLSFLTLWLITFAYIKIILISVVLDCSIEML